jgi:nucleoside-diphosphate-sugar epimerase
MEMTSFIKGDSLLIVGGTGFIGMHLAKKSLDLGLRVSVISKNNKPPSERLKDVEYLSIDIGLYEDLHSQLKTKSYHYVVNLSGYIDHSNYFDGGDKVIDVHFNGTRNLIECLDKKILRSFVQIGSSDEYGSNSAPQNENQRELPFSPYSFSKSASTLFLQMLFKAEGFPSVILRPFLVYGPGQGKNRFIPHVINECIKNSEFPVSPGLQLRDFCLVDDIVDSIILALDNDDAYGEVINIASGEPISIKDIVMKIQNIIGLGKPEFGAIKYRKGENMNLVADITKAKKILNWSPNASLNYGLKKTITYYTSNQSY